MSTTASRTPREAAVSANGRDAPAKTVYTSDDLAGLILKNPLGAGIPGLHGAVEGEMEDGVIDGGFKEPSITIVCYACPPLGVSLIRAHSDHQATCLAAGLRAVTWDTQLVQELREAVWVRSQTGIRLPLMFARWPMVLITLAEEFPCWYGECFTLPAA